MPAYTANTRHDVQSLLEDIGGSTARGYALDDEEVELGVSCIGALVRDATGAAVAGLSVSAGVRGVRRRTPGQPVQGVGVVS
jgi:DNA-binding IclR family transcriptional regulator